MKTTSWPLISNGPISDVNGSETLQDTAVTGELWNDNSNWNLPDYTRVEPHDGRPIWQPEAASVMRTLPLQDWLEQLLVDVSQVIATAARTNGYSMIALTLLAARGTVGLSDPAGLSRDLLSRAMRVTAALATLLTSMLADALLSS